MSWHLPQRLTSTYLTTTYQALSIGLLYSVGATVLLPVAQAATMGKTVVTSAQYQPLVAIIPVADISAAGFLASLANPVVYQQMGLTPNASMSVRFVPTSATTGTVVISTTQPVSMPFADVILAISDKGQREVIPKTLLMPLAKSVPVKPSDLVLTTTENPNLSVMSARDAQPLTIKRGVPPPLFTTPTVPMPDVQNIQVANVQAPTQMQTSPQNAPMTSPLTSFVTTSFKIAPNNRLNTSLSSSNANTATTISNQRPSNINTLGKPENTNAHANADDAVNTLDNSANVVASILLTPAVDFSYAVVNAMDKTDKKLNTLNIQVARKIQLNKKAANSSQPLILANSAPVHKTSKPKKKNLLLQKRQLQKLLIVF